VLIFIPFPFTQVPGRTVTFTRVNGTVSISTNTRLLNQYPCTRSISIHEVMTKAQGHDVIEFKMIRYNYC